MKVKPLLYGTVAGIIIFTATVFLGALILYITKAGDVFIVVAAKIIIALSALAAGYVAGKMCNTRRFLWGLASGLLLFVLTMLFGMVFGGNGGFTADELINLTVSTIFSLIGGMIS